MRMNGGGNGEFDGPSSTVVPSNTILAVAVAERFLLFEPGVLTVVVIGPVPVQLAVTETVCEPPRLSSTLRNVPLTLTLLRFGSNCVGASRTKPQLKVPSGHWPTSPTLRGGVGLGFVPASMKLSVSTIRRPPVPVEPSGQGKEITQRAEATCSVKPFAADVTAGTSSDTAAAERRDLARRMAALLHSAPPFLSVRPPWSNSGPDDGPRTAPAARSRTT